MSVYLIFSDLYSGMMRGLYPGQSANPGRNYSHPGMSSYHQHNLHRYQQVGKTRSNLFTSTVSPVFSPITIRSIIRKNAGRYKFFFNMLVDMVD